MAGPEGEDSSPIMPNIFQCISLKIKEISSAIRSRVATRFGSSNPTPLLLLSKPGPRAVRPWLFG
jgi:hypothetical protein